MTVVTFEDIFQREAEKKSKYSEDYRKFSAQIILDKQDMAGLSVKEGQNVLVKNNVGSIVVVAKASEDDPHPGLAFMVGGAAHGRISWSGMTSVRGYPPRSRHPSRRLPRYLKYSRG